MNPRNAKTITNFRRYAISAIVGFLALGSSAVSLADDSGDVRKMTVKFADLNVSSPQGAAQLYVRIRGAAKSVCAPPTYWATLGTSEMDACVRKAIADAVTKVNQPALYAVYNEHYKPALGTTLLSQSR